MKYRFNALINPLKHTLAYKGTIDSIKYGRFPIHISGISGSEKVEYIYAIKRGAEEKLTSANPAAGKPTKPTSGNPAAKKPGTLPSEKFVSDRTNKPPRYKWNLIIVPDEVNGRKLQDEYKMFDTEILFYPAKDLCFYSANIHGKAIANERLKVIEKLTTGESATVITTMTAGLEMVQSIEKYADNAKFIKTGQEMNFDNFIESLNQMGYVRSVQIENPGEYAVRGGIVDIFTLSGDCPVRIEFWGDEIDTIREFDVDSQRSIETLDEIVIFPASEIII
jgi:transcription-repair coupling factor (superfamily II helicase)